MHGCNANVVFEVLGSACSYYESIKNSCKENCIYCKYFSHGGTCFRCSNYLENQLSKGVSCCRVENEAKILSFVFVTGEKKDDNVTKQMKISDDSDSKGCFVLGGSLAKPNHGYGFEVNNEAVHVYLIVFNIEQDMLSKIR